MDFYVGSVDYIVLLLWCCSAGMVRLPAIMIYVDEHAGE